jgi:hypothetical protein
VAAKLPPPKPSEVEAAVLAVKSPEALELIKKLTYNTVVQPYEEKFRKVGWCHGLRAGSTVTGFPTTTLLPGFWVAGLMPTYPIQVRLSNPKIEQTLGLSGNAVDALVALGWAQDEVDGEPCLVVPAGRYLKMEQVRWRSMGTA